MCPTPAVLSEEIELPEASPVAMLAHVAEERADLIARRRERSRPQLVRDPHRRARERDDVGPIEELLRRDRRVRAALRRHHFVEHVEARGTELVHEHVEHVRGLFAFHEHDPLREIDDLRVRVGDDVGIDRSEPVECRERGGEIVRVEILAELLEPRPVITGGHRRSGS